MVTCKIALGPQDTSHARDASHGDMEKSAGCQGYKRSQGMQAMVTCKKALGAKDTSHARDASHGDM